MKYRSQAAKFHLSLRFNGSLNLDPILQLIYKSVLCQQTIVVLRRIFCHRKSLQFVWRSRGTLRSFTINVQFNFSVFFTLDARCWCHFHGGTQCRDHLTKFLAAHVFRGRSKLYIHSHKMPNLDHKAWRGCFLGYQWNHLNHCKVIEDTIKQKKNVF